MAADFFFFGLATDLNHTQLNKFSKPINARSNYMLPNAKAISESTVRTERQVLTEES